MKLLVTEYLWLCYRTYHGRSFQTNYQILTLARWKLRLNSNIFFVSLYFKCIGKLSIIYLLPQTPFIFSCRVNFFLVSNCFLHLEQLNIAASDAPWFFSRCLFIAPISLYFLPQKPQMISPPTVMNGFSTGSCWIVSLVSISLGASVVYFTVSRNSFLLMLLNYSISHH